MGRVLTLYLYVIIDPFSISRVFLTTLLSRLVHILSSGVIVITGVLVELVIASPFLLCVVRREIIAKISLYFLQK